MGIRRRHSPASGDGEWLRPDPDVRFGSKPDIAAACPHVAEVPCVDGSELARTFFTFAALVGAAMCSAFRCGSHGRWP